MRFRLQPETEEGAGKRSLFAGLLQSAIELKALYPVIARIMPEPLRKLTLPKVDWKTATCEVCGEPFDYTGKRRPHTCQTGECRYKHHYKIEPKTWATYQPTFFDAPEA